MVGSVVGLVASLLSLVLSLLIWTSYGLFTTQQSQLQTLGRSIIQLDFALSGYGSEALQGRALLEEHVKRLRARACGTTDWPHAAPSITRQCPRTCWQCAPATVDGLPAFGASQSRTPRSNALGLETSRSSVLLLAALDPKATFRLATTAWTAFLCVDGGNKRL